MASVRLASGDAMPKPGAKTIPRGLVLDARGIDPIQDLPYADEPRFRQDLWQVEDP